MDSVLSEQSIEFRLLSEHSNSTVKKFLNKHLTNTHKFILSGLNIKERYIIYSSCDKTIKFKKLKNKSISIQKNDGVDTFSESSNDISLDNNKNEDSEKENEDSDTENENVNLLNKNNPDYSDSEFSNSIETNNDNISIDYNYIINEIKKDNRLWFTVLLSINILNLFIQISNYHK